MIERYPDTLMLAKAAADRFIALAGEAVRTRGRFAVALSGGGTPRVTYEYLAMAEQATEVDWPHVHIFWGDERCVPPDSPESNYRMARESLLDQVPIPAENIHRIRGELPPEEAAADYERQLQEFFDRQDSPRFDLTLLGLGEDGHTASLFPHTAALQEMTRRATANYVPRLAAWRITLTAPVINRSETVVFLVTGARKAQILHDVLRGPLNAASLPAQMIHPASGNLIWMVDDTAAALLAPD